MATFDHLCETFLDENCVLTSKDDLMEVTTQILITKHMMLCKNL